MKKILCISEVCCDMIFGGMPKLPGPGEEVFCQNFSMQPGGGSNTPHLLARIGIPTAYLTAIGWDVRGDVVRRELEKSGLKLILLPIPDYDTPVSAVLGIPGDRSFATYAFTGTLPCSEALLEEAVKEADIVHSFISYALDLPIAELCEKHGKELSLDAAFDDSCRPEARDLLGRCDYLKVNEEEGLRISGNSTAEEALRYLSSRVRKAAVITLGEKGAAGAEKDGEMIYQPAVSYGPFKDACGAGDAFMAGFLAAVSSGAPLSEALRRGAELAGRCVSWVGGVSAGELF